MTCVVLVGNWACELCCQQRKLCGQQDHSQQAEGMSGGLEAQGGGAGAGAEEVEEGPRDEGLHCVRQGGEHGGEWSAEEDAVKWCLKQMEGLLMCLAEMLWMEGKERKEARRKQEGRGE
jgi:hypothetical protein